MSPRFDLKDTILIVTNTKSSVECLPFELMNHSDIHKHKNMQEGQQSAYTLVYANMLVNTKTRMFITSQQTHKIT